MLVRCSCIISNLDNPPIKFLCGLLKSSGFHLSRFWYCLDQPIDVKRIQLIKNDNRDCKPFAHLLWSYGSSNTYDQYLLVVVQDARFLSTDRNRKDRLAGEGKCQVL